MNSKCIALLISVLALFSSTNASFMVEKMEPKCSLSGETYTMTYQ